MASTVSIYKGVTLLGTGSAAAASASITSWTAQGDTPAIARRNVQVTVTQAGTNIGRTWNTNVLTDNGSGTLTLNDACPFVGA